jgi:hypothetical protein
MSSKKTQKTKMIPGESTTDLSEEEVFKIWREEQRESLTLILPYIEHMRDRFREEVLSDKLPPSETFAVAGLLGVCELVLKEKDDFPEDALPFFMEKALSSS